VVPVNDVRVGDVVVPLGKRKLKGKEIGNRNDSSANVTGGKLSGGGQPSIRKLIRMYRSREEDVQWARKGVVATVSNGENIPLVQNRIADAGFSDIDIIPLGADRVLIYSSSDVHVSTIVQWEKKVASFQRGAWLRL